jgi:hypothetical protein
MCPAHRGVAPLPTELSTVVIRQSNPRCEKKWTVLRTVSVVELTVELRNSFLSNPDKRLRPFDQLGYTTTASSHGCI